MKFNPDEINVIIDYRRSDGELYSDHLCLPSPFLECEDDLRAFYLICYPDRIIEYVWRVVPVDGGKNEK